MLRDYQQRVGVRFKTMVQVRLDQAEDNELLVAMRQAGINSLAIGFESPIAEELKAMNKRLNPQKMVNLTKLYHRAGFRIHGMFIFGYPAPEGVTFKMPAEDRVRQFSRFIQEAGIDTVQIMLPIPLPGTELTARLGKAHRIFSTDVVGLEYYDGNFPVIQPDAPLTAVEMQACVQEILRRFYGPRHLLAVALHVLTFPAVALRLHNIGAGWQRWYRAWMASLLRSGGWLLLRKWTAAFRKDGFLGKLAQAQRSNVQPGPGTSL
jgi:hypothetical protein